MGGGQSGNVTPPTHSRSGVGPISSHGNQPDMRVGVRGRGPRQSCQGLDLQGSNSIMGMPHRQLLCLVAFLGNVVGSQATQPLSPTRVSRAASKELEATLQTGVGMGGGGAKAARS